MPREGVAPLLRNARSRPLGRLCPSDDYSGDDDDNDDDFFFFIYLFPGQLWAHSSGLRHMLW